ncbi:MAG: LysR family transcriptional regulator [Spirochaetales bacterium]|nr:LysR family transcriptional regulator [Spirochaetales bacterium]
MINKIHLQILYEVDKRGTLTEAAEALCLTQPALTHTIKKLEGELGTALWVRDGRRIKLTQSGEYLLGTAKRLLPQFEHTEEILRRYARGSRGLLRIGMECHPCYNWLMLVTEPYLGNWPDVDIDIKREFQFGGIKALEDHDIDILVTPDPIRSESLTFYPAFDYELVLAAGESHPLGNRPFVEPEDLLDQTLITYPVGQEKLDVYTGFLIPAGCAPYKRETIETTDIMLQMVSAGRGVTALPFWLIEEYGQKLPLRSYRLGREGIHKQINLGFRTEEGALDYLMGFLSEAGLSDLSIKTAVPEDCGIKLHEKAP